VRADLREAPAVDAPLRIIAEGVFPIGIEQSWTGYQYRFPLPSLAQYNITHKERREMFVSGCWQGDEIMLTYNGGPDSSRVDRFRVYVKDQELIPALTGSPGSTASFPSEGITSPGDVIVIARFTDGMEQGVGVSWCASSEKAPWD
jgi:hypothetical protein